MAKLKKLRTISVRPQTFQKFTFAKIQESWTQKMSLKNDDFIALLLETYPDPPKKKD